MPCDDCVGACELPRRIWKRDCASVIQTVQTQLEDEVMRWPIGAEEEGAERSGVNLSESQPYRYPGSCAHRIQDGSVKEWQLVQQIEDAVVQST